MVSESSFPNGKTNFEKMYTTFTSIKCNVDKKKHTYCISEGHLQKDLDKVMVRLQKHILGSQDGARMAQDGAKMAQDGAKRSPSWSQDGARWSQDGAR